MATQQNLMKTGHRIIVVTAKGYISSKPSLQLVLQKELLIFHTRIDFFAFFFKGQNNTGLILWLEIKHGRSDPWAGAGSIETVRL